jgi:hypothetical protein
MVTVGATCRACNTWHEYAPSVVRLVAYDSDPPTFVILRCADCLELMRIECPPNLIAQLTAAHVAVVRLAPERAPVPGPMTLDDRIDLGIWMESF